MSTTKRDSRPICKHKENCKDYKLNMCQFSHPICKFGIRCNKPDCIFTHDPLKYEDKMPSQNSKKKICKFGSKCTKVK